MIAGLYSDLRGKTVLIAGASSGIGKACAIALDKQGCKTILTGRNEESLRATATQFETTPIIIKADLTKKSDRDRLTEELPAIDGMCYAAGIINPFPIRFIEEEQIERIFSINTEAPILLTARLLRQKKFKENASIVYISSIASDRAMIGGSLYSASKAALESFSKTITLENSHKKIRANCIRPALVKTPILDAAKQKALDHGSLEKYESYMDRYPLGLGAPEDIAAAVSFLTSESSRWISGTSLVMDGSFSASI